MGQILTITKIIHVTDIFIICDFISFFFIERTYTIFQLYDTMKILGQELLNIGRVIFY